MPQHSSKALIAGWLPYSAFAPKSRDEIEMSSQTTLTGSCWLQHMYKHFDVFTGFVVVNAVVLRYVQFIKGFVSFISPFSILIITGMLY